MKKKGLAVLLCLCMVVSLLPVTALAAGQWTYYPKSDEEHRLSGYIKQGDLQVGVMSEKEADTGDKSLYNLVIDGNGDNIPAGVTEVDLTGTIKDEAGQLCYITELGSAIVKNQITSITLPDTVKRISDNACLNAALTSINFPASLESIGYGAFSGSDLTAADLSQTQITTLESSTFYHCYSLASVQLPSTLTTIEEIAFGGCSGLTELTLPQSVSQIKWMAFSGSGLETLTVQATTPPTLEDVDALNCPQLETIFVPENSVTAYRTAEGWKDYADKIWAIGSDPVTYGLSVSSPEVAFGSFVSGNVPAAQTVTITNTGTGTVEVSLPSNENFDITAGTDFTGNTATIAGGKTASFTIRPKNSAVDKTVSETITIQGTPTDSDSPARPSVTVTASYHVTAKLTYTISAAPETLNFDSFTAGDALPEAREVTVTNTGTGTVEVSLPSSEKFTITAGTGFSNGTATLEANETATFTVQPKDVSAEGTVSETITITGTSVGATPAETPTASVTASYTVAFPKVTVGGVELKAAPGGTVAYALTDETGAVTTEGASASQYNIKWDGETLTLKGAAIAVTGQHGIQSDEDLTLVLEDASSIRMDKQEGSTASYSGIYNAGKNLTITGTGSLDITADSSAIRAAALTVRDAALSLVSQSSSGISADSMTVESGSVTARGLRNGISVTGALSVSAAAYLNACGDEAALEVGSITIAGTPYTEEVDNLKVVIENGILTQTGVLYVNGVDILEDGAVLPQGVSYQQSTNTLTLTDAAIQEYYQKDRGFFGIYTNGDLNLALEGSNSISSRAITGDAEVYGIAVQGALTISGAGSLEIAGASGPEETINYGIMTLDGFTLQSGSVTITLGSCEVNMGLYGGKGVLVEGGALTIKPAAVPQTTEVSMGIIVEAGSEELDGKSAVHITGGTVSVEGNELIIPAADVNDSLSNGISAASVLVEGGTVTVRSGDITVEGTGAEAGRTAAVISTGIGTGQLVIKGGTVTAQCGQITCADDNIEIVQGALYFDHDEDGYEAEKMLTVSPKAPGAIAVKLGAAAAGATEIAGSPFTGETVIGYDALKQAAYFRSEVVAPLTLTADKASLTGGGTVKLTVGGPLVSNTDESAKLTVTCSDSSVTVTGGPDVWTASLPNADKDYTFTVAYTSDTYPDGITAQCAVHTTYQSQGGGGGGGSSSGGTTETIKNPDGSTTTTVTKPDGSTVETTKNPDGSQQVVNKDKDGTVTTTTTDKTGNKTETVEKTDGTSQTTVTNKDGSGSVTSVTESGQVETEVKLPAAVVGGAAEKEEAVALPMPNVPVTSDRENAPTVTVDLPSGTSAKVEIPVKGVTAGTVAVLVKADGTQEVLKDSLATEKGITVTLSDGDTVKIVDNAKTFADVSDGYWAADAIDFTTSREIFAGTSDTTFAPGGTMTRAMIWTVLARYEGTDTTATDSQNWYTPGRSWAMETGVSDGSDPNGTITREQLAAMLYRYAVSSGVDVSVGENTNILSYSDASKVSEYAIAAMQWACGAGIITGTTGDTLDPNGPATRAQTAVIFQRFCQAIAQ